jgi:hypothetical protein
MRHLMSLKARRELLAVTAPRYQTSTKKQKQRMLDEFVAATGYHRQYAIPLLKHYQATKERPAPPPTKQGRSKRGRRPIYTDEVKQALIITWEAACRICSKRLVPFLPVLIPVLEKHGYLNLTQEVRQKLLTVSPATVDRLLCSIRHGRGGKGIGTTQPGGLLKHQIPIRTFTDWNDVRPGFIEADLVAHCGNKAGGPHLHTLVFTDVATGWLEFKPLLFRDQDTTALAIHQLRQQQPFKLLGLDTDNGREFMNYTLLDYCLKEQITFTRARSYKKNDQCYVEQKNGSVVRKFIGYDRFEGLKPCRVLEAMYAVLRLYVNYFQPSLKLVAKTRSGSHVSRKYDKAQTPCQRVLAADTISADVKASLKAQFAQLDPVALLRHIDRLQDELWSYAYRERVTRVSLDEKPILAPVKREGICQQPAGGSRTFSSPPKRQVSCNHAAPDGDAAQTESDRPQRLYRKQKNKYKGERWWRTRPDDFAKIWPEVVQQLEQTPDLQTRAFFLILQRRYPGEFKDGQLRTFYRRVRQWRRQAAAQKLSAEDDH